MGKSLAELRQELKNINSQIRAKKQVTSTRYEIAKEASPEIRILRLPSRTVQGERIQLQPSREKGEQGVS